VSGKNQSTHSISCEICEDLVTVLNKRNNIFICKKCEDNYPIYKK